MTPVISPDLASRGPACVVDEQSTMAELEVEVRWRLHVEGEHLIVGVPAEASTDCISKFCASIQGSPDIVLAGDLEHQVTKARRLESDSRVG